MPEIRPSSDLRNKYNEISSIVHQFDEPVYITKNGHGDMVLLSIEAYEKLVGKFELKLLLDEAEKDIQDNKLNKASDTINRIKGDYFANEDL